MTRSSWACFLLVGLVWLGALGQVVELSPADPEELGSWSQPAAPFRLNPTPPRGVEYRGPEMALRLWGELKLGRARYALVLGVSQTGTPGLWVDSNRDRTIDTEELASGARGNGFYLWRTTLTAEPEGSEPYSYTLGVLWPEGRGYVYLIGGAPREGLLELEGQPHALVLVDGDMDGVFGTEGDFYAVDVDGDGEITGDSDGHEHFSLEEPFTVGEKSYRLAQVASDGRTVTLAETEYVSPKLPLIPGHPAPDFSFTPLRGDQEVSLSDFRGKVVLLDFWATWCGPCMAELPNVLSMYQELHDQGFEIIGISLDTSESELRSVLQERGIAWPQYYDGKGWDNEIAGMYRVFGIPATFLLDRKGIIRYRDLRGEDLREKVLELLAEPPPEEPEPTPSQAEPPPIETTVEAPPQVAPTAEPILELSLPDRFGLPVGEEAELAVQLTNSSPHLAEEIVLRLVDPPDGLEAESAELAELAGFGQRTLTIKLRAEEALAPGEYPLKLLLTYHYCIGDSCFQMSDEAELTLAVGEEVPAAKAPPNPWWILILIGAGVALAWLLLGKGTWALSLLLVLLAGAALGLGVYLGQARQAQLIGAVICTSCVGIETERHDQPQLSPEAVAALQGLSRPVTLVVFHAPWCHSCPYAIAMAQEFARVNSDIRVELVDAEEDTQRAIQAGVFRSGRLVVPAILNPATGEVVFGITDLEARLLELVVGEGR
ncbi:hypothetical protein DRJ54_05740 [Candidatus Acetothermia bacterium]|nr:MAG: hypothetical protein DRJ54_05740 [Candidatus Acetothermia bacterium]